VGSWAAEEVTEKKHNNKREEREEFRVSKLNLKLENTLI